jgi:hypothetical protein
MYNKFLKSESYIKLVAKLKETKFTADGDVVWRTANALWLNDRRELKNEV